MSAAYLGTTTFFFDAALFHVLPFTNLWFLVHLFVIGEDFIIRSRIRSVIFLHILTIFFNIVLYLSPEVFLCLEILNYQFLTLSFDQFT